MSLKTEKYRTLRHEHQAPKQPLDNQLKPGTTYIKPQGIQDLSVKSKANSEQVKRNWHKNPTEAGTSSSESWASFEAWTRDEWDNQAFTECEVQHKWDEVRVRKGQMTVEYQEYVEYKRNSSWGRYIGCICRGSVIDGMRVDLIEEQMKLDCQKVLKTQVEAHNTKKCNWSGPKTFEEGKYVSAMVQSGSAWKDEE